MKIVLGVTDFHNYHIIIVIIIIIIIIMVIIPTLKYEKSHSKGVGQRSSHQHNKEITQSRPQNTWADFSPSISGILVY